MSTRPPTIDIISIAQQDSLVERRRDDPLLDVLLKLLAFEIAAKHVAGAQLACAECILVAGGHRHERAPLFQT
jgi:cytochrome c